MWPVAMILDSTGLEFSGPRISQRLLLSLEEESHDYWHELPIPWDLPFPGIHTTLQVPSSPLPVSALWEEASRSLCAPSIWSLAQQILRKCLQVNVHITLHHTLNTTHHNFCSFFRCYSRAFLYGDPLHPRPFLRLQEFDSCLELWPENSSYKLWLLNNLLFWQVPSNV